MMSSSIPSLLLLLLTLSLSYKFISGERRISQEEWQRFRFGGMPMASDPSQWAFPGMPPMNMDMAEFIQAPAPPPAPQSQTPLETNIQDVEVGNDKLVLVNDQGAIKMLRASQLPTVNKQNQDVTTQVPNTVLQMPLEQYLTKDSNQNPTKNPNPIEIMNPNFGGGNRVQGLPVAFATSSNQPDRPNVVYQTQQEYNNPCVKASDNPPIYIPAPQVTATTSRSTDNRKMVRIIIEMPEAMTRNIDEASRYAATQVQRLKVSDEVSHKPRRKIKKNVHEVIRKVVQMEEDNDEPEEETHSMSEHSSAEDMADDASTQSNGNHVEVIHKTTEDNDSNSGRKYVIVRKSGRLRSGQRKLKSMDKYKKIIKVYRE